MPPGPGLPGTTRHLRRRFFVCPVWMFRGMTGFSPNGWLPPIAELSRDEIGCPERDLSVPKFQFG